MSEGVGGEGLEGDYQVPPAGPPNGGAQCGQDPQDRPLEGKRSCEAWGHLNLGARSPVGPGPCLWSPRRGPAPGRPLSSAHSSARSTPTACSTPGRRRGSVKNRRTGSLPPWSLRRNWGDRPRTHPSAVLPARHGVQRAERTGWLAVPLSQIVWPPRLRIQEGTLVSGLALGGRQRDGAQVQPHAFWQMCRLGLKTFAWAEQEPWVVGRAEHPGLGVGSAPPNLRWLLHNVGV